VTALEINKNLSITSPSEVPNDDADEPNTSHTNQISKVKGSRDGNSNDQSASVSE
jgi:hypothetical protein